MMTFIWLFRTFYVTSGLADMTSLSFPWLISLLFYIGFSHNLVGEIWDIHVTLRSYKISCQLEGHVDHLGQLQSK